ncbi:hypothetical protein HDU93_007995 [Gonapodya sp. JEL0774]|nr:hypothetical protein HDU93_007995 [Gonapodya sp. JEL0774]
MHTTPHLVLPLALLFAATARPLLVSSSSLDLQRTFVVPGITAEVVYGGLDVLARGPLTSAILSFPLPVPPPPSPSPSPSARISSGFPLPTPPTVLLDTRQTNEVFRGGLTHGIALSRGDGDGMGGRWLYASSTGEVYRWPYTPPTPLSLPLTQLVVRGIPPDAGHNTRTLVLSPDGRSLYVSIGAVNDVDPDSQHARVVQFDLEAFDKGNATRPLEWIGDGVVVADGVRNAVAMRFDPFAGNGGEHLWEADNGPDGLVNKTLGESIAEDNPGEELNLFNITDLKQGPRAPFYGYPFCFTEGIYPRTFQQGPGSQHTWPGFSFDCTNSTVNIPPILTMPAHVAPIDLVFFEQCNASSSHSLPCEWQGDMFVSLHGSLRRTIAPVGYKIVRIPFGKSSRLPSEGPVDVFGHIDPATKCPISTMKSCLRPAGLAFDAFGRLYTSLDSTGEIVVVRRVLFGEKDDEGSPITMSPEADGNVRFVSWGVRTSRLVFWVEFFLCIGVVLIL